jgi:hypothetical protein
MAKGRWGMSEPSVEEIVAKGDQCGNLHGADLLVLISSWRDRGEAISVLTADLVAVLQEQRKALVAFKGDPRADALLHRIANLLAKVEALKRKKAALGQG